MLHLPLLLFFFYNHLVSIHGTFVGFLVGLLVGDGPQGGTFGILEFLSQSNDSADMVKTNDRFKFVDELTVFQIINLLMIQITSYDIVKHVPSDIPTHNGYIDKEMLQSQKV